MAEVVLDASAVLALLRGEPGADAVAAWVGRARISAVNWAEVVGQLARAGVAREDVALALDALRLEVVPLDAGLADEVGWLDPRTRPRGLSLGDRACIALARRDGLPALTADRAWLGLDVGVEVRVIRGSEGQSC